VIAERQSPTEKQTASGPVPSLLRRYVWWIVAIALIGASAGIVRWAGTRPGYDPYGWLVWGYQTLHGGVSLRGAPSWKPLPWVFTTPFALFGHYQLWLWMTLAVAASFAGCIFAGRIAFRVVDDGGRAGRRWPAIGAAIFAGVALLLIFDNEGYSYLHYVLSVQSDPPIVSLCLAAIDLYMIRRHRWAIAMLTLASLGRPEVWPFLGLYCLWYWLRLQPNWKGFTYVAVCVLIVPLLWFGVPWITNGDPLVAANLAQGSPRELRSNKVLGTLGRFKDLNLWAVWALAAIGSAWAFWRRKRFVMVLFGCVAVWIVIEIAFALHGWPAVPRYVFEPAGVSIVIAAIGFGWLLAEIPQVLRAERLRALPAWAGVIAAAGLIGWGVPGAITRARNEHADIKLERARTAELSRLAGFVHLLGGTKRIYACGAPVVNVEFVSALGWLIHKNTDQIGYRPLVELRKRTPIVLLTSLPNGWAAYPWHTQPSMRATCDAKMRVIYVFTPHHPSGVLSPNNVPPRA
jgi:hypothetical protein